MYLKWSRSNTDENGFDAESERGYRCIDLPSQSKEVQAEAMRFNIQLMKWRLFPSLDVRHFTIIH